MIDVEKLKTAREMFQRLGKLNKCSHPRHEHIWGRLVWEWQLSRDGWANMNIHGHLVTTHLGFQTVETTDGCRIHNIIVGRVVIRFGWTS